MHLSLDPAITSGMYCIYIYLHIVKLHTSFLTPNRKKGTAQMKMTSAGHWQVTVHPNNEIRCSYEREWVGFPTDVEMHARYVIKEIRIYIVLLMMTKLWLNMDKDSRWMQQRWRLKGVESRQTYNKKGRKLSTAHFHTFQFSNYVVFCPFKYF